MKFSGLLRKWIRPHVGLLVLLPWLVGATECNLLSGSANKTSDAALMFAAQQQIDASQYSTALTTLSGVSAVTLATHDGLVMQASANAGVCGLNLANLAQSVSNVASGTSLLALTLSYMSGATSYAGCKTAETEMLSIAAAQMTSDDYVFLTFIEFAKIGAVLESSPSGADPTHSGTVASTFTPCNSSTTGISDTEVAEIGLGINLAVSSIASSGLTIAASLLADVTAVCSAQAALCSVTSTSGFTAADLLLIRTAINTQEVGLNTCPGSFSSVACTCL